ncbi:MAG: hypothetical protein GXO74_07705 [Calditrichaeota bacterium]|nr:hypothetical protein [Calditrichota bacterium]
MKIIILKYLIPFLLLGSVSVQAQNDLFLSLSTMKAKPLSMASAYTSVEDNLVSGLYNPASLRLFKGEKNFRVTFFLNPIAPASAIYERYGKEPADPSLESRSVWKDALLLFKGVVISAKFLDFGLVFNEQIIDPRVISQQKDIFSYYDFSKNSSHSAILHLRLADRVSLGASGTLFLREQGDKVQRGFGFSYGILMKPAKRMNAGVVYHYLPRLMSDVRIPLEKMVDQTINVGLSYYPFDATTLSLDLRNLTEEKGKSVIELRFGVEQRVFSLFALRGGYFKERFSDREQISAGIGILDTNIFFSRAEKFQRSPFLLNYAVIFEKNNAVTTRWHVVTFGLRF